VGQPGVLIHEESMLNTKESAIAPDQRGEIIKRVSGSNDLSLQAVGIWFLLLARRMEERQWVEGGLMGNRRASNKTRGGWRPALSASVRDCARPRADAQIGQWRHALGRRRQERLVGEWVQMTSRRKE
jgi:hypothetical protein